MFQMLLWGPVAFVSDTPEPDAPASLYNFVGAIAKESHVLASLIVMIVGAFVGIRYFVIPALKIYKESAALHANAASDYKAAAITHRRAIRVNTALTRNLIKAIDALQKATPPHALDHAHTHPSD